MKILYLSCHEVHEIDDTIMFLEMGHQIYTKGTIHNESRPVIPNATDGNSEFLTKNECNQLFHCHSEKIKSYMVEKFDLIYVLSLPNMVIKNWDEIKHKKVIFRLNGQSDCSTPNLLKPYAEEGLILVGYSPHENERFKGIAPITKTIRFYKDKEQFCGWKGDFPYALSVNSNIGRGQNNACNEEAYRQISSKIDITLIGRNNEDYKGSIGHVPYEILKEQYRSYRAFLYLGTKPASYTFNFIEAWMTGIPIVALGQKFETGEISQLIDHKENGFIANSTDEAIQYLDTLIKNPSLGKEIGEKGRKKAISLFDKIDITNQWKELLNEIDKTIVHENISSNIPKNTILKRKIPKFMEQYRKLIFRYPSFLAALLILVQRSDSRIIVESGCQRLPDDWGAGCSTTVFGHFCSEFGGHLHTIDINAINLEFAKNTTTQYSNYITYHLGDSIEVLKKINTQIDLLYLDSLDYAVENYTEIQTHHLNEFLSAKPFISAKTIILIDDNNLEGGGKGKLIKEHLLKKGWELILDDQQALLIKNEHTS